MCVTVRSFRAFRLSLGHLACLLFGHFERLKHIGVFCPVISDGPFSSNSSRVSVRSLRTASTLCVSVSGHFGLSFALCAFVLSFWTALTLCVFLTGHFGFLSNTLCVLTATFGFLSYTIGVFHSVLRTGFPSCEHLLCSRPVISGGFSILRLTSSSSRASFFIIFSIFDMVLARCA